MAVEKIIRGLSKNKISKQPKITKAAIKILLPTEEGITSPFFQVNKNIANAYPPNPPMTIKPTFHTISKIIPMTIPIAKQPNK